MRTIPWPLEAGEIEEALRAVQFRHYKWDLYHRGEPHILPDVLVLSPAEHEELAGAAEAVWAALRELEAAVLRDGDAIAGVGVPPGLRPALARSRPASPRVTRCDLHLTPGGSWLISEFNEDCPAGFVETEGVPRVLAEACADRLQGLRAAGDLRAALTSALSPYERVGVVYPTGYSEDLQHAALVAEWLREAGHTAVMGSPANLVASPAGAAIFDEPVDALFRYFPGEWIAELPNLADWERASETLPMMNELGALVAESKRFYAAAEEHELAISERAREQITAHIPTSRYLHPPRRGELVLERDRWVLKRAFGRMGEAVCLGPGVTPEQWERALDEALASDELFAVQACFETAPLWFSRGLGYPTVGVFLVDGAFAGYFTRVSKNPIVDYDSAYVPTLVEVS